MDMGNVRRALFLNDIEGVKAALVNTQKRLDNLHLSIAEFFTNPGQRMPQRLNQILSGIESNLSVIKSYRQKHQEIWIQGLRHDCRGGFWKIPTICWAIGSPQPRFGVNNQ